MDDIVRRAMAKWPNVPSVFGWLSLDRRGHWLLKGDRVTNPGIAEFAARLVAKLPANPEFNRYPTGATLVADFNIDSWDQASFGTGVVDDFVIPREIVA